MSAPARTPLFVWEQGYLFPARAAKSAGWKAGATIPAGQLALLGGDAERTAVDMRAEGPDSRMAGVATWAPLQGEAFREQWPGTLVFGGKP